MAHDTIYYTQLLQFCIFAFTNKDVPGYLA